MNVLIDHLLYILVRKGKVNVPELGTFSLEYHSASFVNSGENMLPPHASLKFSNHWNENAGNLVSSFARKFIIEEKKASTLIEKGISEIYRKLATGETIKIGKFGQLCLSKGGEITFVKTQNKMFPWYRALYLGNNQNYPSAIL